MSVTPSNVIIVDNLAVDLAPKLTAEARSEKRLLHVDWNERDGKLSYTIYSPEPEGDWVQQVPNESEQIEHFWKQLNIILNEAITTGSPSEEAWEGICLSLQGIGEWVFKHFIPLELANRVREWQSGFSVIVSTNDKWIPWELMHDGEDFWGHKFIIARYPRFKEGENRPDKSRQKRTGLKQIKEIVNVIGGQVPVAEANKASELFNELLPLVSVKVLQEPPVSKLKDVVSKADILHCTCHGHLQDVPFLQIYANTSKTQNLSIYTIETLPFKPGSFVFANTCYSSTPVQTCGEVSNFGWQFYLQGADVFLGTLGTVPAKYAVSFAENFYEQLLRKDVKLTIGQAVAKAKEVAAREHNIFWLLYCIYGDPDFYFEDI